MRKIVATVAAAIQGAWTRVERRLPEPPQASMAELAEGARKEWEDAVSYFDSVSDPLLIDSAIHRVAAAEQRYRYILNAARAETQCSDSSSNSWTRHTH